MCHIVTVRPVLIVGGSFEPQGFCPKPSSCFLFCPCLCDRMGRQFRRCRTQISARRNDAVQRSPVYVSAYVGRSQHCRNRHDRDCRWKIWSSRSSFPHGQMASRSSLVCGSNSHSAYSYYHCP